MREPKEEKFVFFPFGNRTLFAGNLVGFSLFPMTRLVEEKPIPSYIFDGDADSKCVSKHFFLYSMAKSGMYKKGQFQYKKLIESIPKCNDEKCDIDVNELLKVLSSLSDYELGRIFDCRILNLNVKFSDVAFLMHDDTEYYASNKDLEKTFIGMLSIYFASKYEPEKFLCSGQLPDPFLSNEMDIVLNHKGKTLIIEFSCKSEIGGKYLYTKLVNHHLLVSQFSRDVKTLIAYSGKSELGDAALQLEHILHHKDNIKIIPIKDKYVCPTNEKWKSIGFEQIRSMFSDLIEDIENEVRGFLFK